MLTMDPNFASVIIAIITGVFAIYMKKFENKQAETDKKVDEQGAVVEQLNLLSAEISKKNAEKAIIMDKILIIVMKSNIAMLKYATEEEEQKPFYEEGDELIKQYLVITEEIQELNNKIQLINTLSKDKSKK